MENAAKFEIHYHLLNESHSMDAFVRNKCEAEFLAIAYEIISQLELGIVLEAEAWIEGGLRDRWKTLSLTDKMSAITLLVTVLGVVLSRVPLSDPLQDARNCLEIEKLRQELSQNVISQTVIDSCANYIQKSPKIRTRRSNFYKQLHHNKKVEKIGFSFLDKDNKPIADEIPVPRTDFPKFILLSNKLPVEIIEDAQIEIVAPVLSEGNAKWKGIYIDPTPIPFEMNDRVFKEAVLAKQIGFKNGDIILCVLEIHRELNEVGEVVITKYVVQTVLDKIENGVRKETASGKRYRREQEAKKDQGSLDF